MDKLRGMIRWSVERRRIPQVQMLPQPDMRTFGLVVSTDLGVGVRGARFGGRCRSTLPSQSLARSRRKAKKKCTKWISKPNSILRVPEIKWLICSEHAVLRCHILAQHFWKWSLKYCSQRKLLSPIEIELFVKHRWVFFHKKIHQATK